jgi:hypothetical protein
MLLIDLSQLRLSSLNDEACVVPRCSDSLFREFAICVFVLLSLVVRAVAADSCTGFEPLFAGRAQRDPLTVGAGRLALLMRDKLSVLL